MTEETSRRFDGIEQRIGALEKKVDRNADRHSCPQPGCRFMESKASRVGNVANWISALALAGFVLSEILRAGGAP